MLGSNRSRHPQSVRAAALSLALLASSAPGLHAQPAFTAVAEDAQDEDDSPAQPDASAQAGETAVLTSDAPSSDEGAAPAANADDAS
jgi:hypothetical protein